MILLSAALVSPFDAVAQSDAGMTEALRAEIELLQDSGRLGYDGIDMLEPDTVAAIYVANRFTPVWSDTARVEGLLRTVRGIEDEGLSPSDYRLEHIEAIVRIRTEDQPLTGRAAAVSDILLTDSLSRLYLDLRFGKLTRGERAADIDAGAIEPAVLIRLLAESASLKEMLASALPRSPQYIGLSEVLREYRRIAAEGGWPSVADGATLEPGAEDSRLPALQERLIASGDLATRHVAPDMYDADLQSAVRRFQSRHGLEPDALVGAATLRAMNVPVEDRIDQIRVNLERMRLAAQTDEAVMLVVNTAAFELALYKDDVVVWTTRVIAGDPENQTPELESALQYLVLNPTWTVPRSISTEELLPRIRADAGFLVRGGYDLVDRGGNVVDTATIDWDELSEENFPFTLVQRAGPVNELGRLKFIFSNRFGVSMHDTPNRHLFERAARHFSHGCIRVDQPIELATYLLESETWTRDALEEELATGETRTIFPPESIAISVIYRTATADSDGEISFYPDVYERDPAVIAALEPDQPGS